MIRLQVTVLGVVVPVMQLLIDDEVTRNVLGVVVPLMMQLLIDDDVTSNVLGMVVQLTHREVCIIHDIV